MNGRKRHLLVDTQGFVLRVAVHEASVQDREGARRVLGHLRDDFPAVSLVWADAAYRSEELNAWLEQESGCRLEIVARPPRTAWQREGETAPPQASFVVLKPALGGGADLRLDGQVAAPEQRLRAVAGDERGAGLGHPVPNHAAQARQTERNAGVQPTQGGLSHVHSASCTTS